MTSEEKDKILREISKNTLMETIDKLNKNNKVLVVRPTGFGKSYMLAGLTSSELPGGNLRFKKCLYVYPTKVIKQDVVNTYGPNGEDERAGMLINTTFISYMKITRLVDTLLKNKEVEIIKRELYDGIWDISSDGDWVNTKGKVESEIIRNRQGSNSLRAWFSQFDLIMLDECHRVGSNGFINAWDIIGSLVSNSVKLVGVTATPDRLDGKNIKDIFGKSNQISRLELKDCIKQGILNKFDYVYTIGDRQKFYESAVSELNKIRKKDGNEELYDYEKEELRKELSKLESISDVLKKSIKPCNMGGKNYMRFVVFFEDSKHIEKHGGLVENWFKTGFSDKSVCVYNIISKNNNKVNYEISDVDILQVLDNEMHKNGRENIIDLIFSIDKLNMGYHVESITGIVLFRETNSAILYNQQIGRCFSVRSDNKPIIFDIIDKTGMGNIIDSINKDSYTKGEKQELPRILDKECVDVDNKAGNIIKLIKNMRKQNYDAKEQIVRFLSENRHAPVEVISQMTGLRVQDIKNMLEDK